MDRDKIWRVVRNNYQSLEQAAPEGLAPLIEVSVAGRAEPIRLAEVHTSRDPDDPWVLLIAVTKPVPTASPDECLVFVPEHYIERVELRFERAEGRNVGFAHRVLEDSSPSNGE